MKSLLLLLQVTAVLLLSGAATNAQSNNRYAVLQNNYQNINPAAINHLYHDYLNSSRLIQVSLQARNQQVENGDALHSQNLRVEYFTPDAKVFFAGSINREQLNIQQTTRVTGNLSYQIDLDQRGSSSENMKLLNIGMGVADNFQSADLQHLPFINPAHQILPITNARYSTVSAGAFLLLKDKRSPDIYAGLSGYHNLSTVNTPASTQLFFVGGMLFSTKSRTFLFEPNLIAHYAKYDGFIVSELNKNLLNASAGLRVWYYPPSRFGFFGGTSLSTNEEAQLEFGLSLYPRKQLKRLPTRSARKARRSRKPALRISYSYHFPTGDEAYPTPSQNLVVVFPIHLRSSRGRRSRSNQRTRSTAPEIGLSRPATSKM